MVSPTQSKRKALNLYCFRFCLLMAVTVLLLSMVIMGIAPFQLPWSPPGLHTPVLVVEFLGSMEEALMVFGPEKIGLDSVVEGIYWDFGYIACYSLLLTSFAVAGWLQTQNKNLLLCIPIIAIAATCDVFENQILLEITDRISNTIPSTSALNQDGTTEDINFILLRTWVNSKFTAITMVSTLLFPFVMSQHSRFPISSRIFAVATLIALASSLAIWFTRWIMPEVLSLAIAACWATIATRAFYLSRSS